MQFSKHEDFGVYPKARVSRLFVFASSHLCLNCSMLSQEEDHRKLVEMGCAAVFEPLSLYHPGTIWLMGGIRM